MGPTRILIGLVFPFIVACHDNGLDVRFLRAENYEFSATEQRLIRRSAESSTREARQLLHGLPSQLELTIRPGTDVMPETGSSATAMPPAAILITIDAARNGGVQPIVTRWLRPILFHELHHLARSQTIPARSVVEHAVSEGMAAVFERDFAHSHTPWAEYGPEVNDWAKEIMAVPDDASTRDWIFQHPDGRRWIGMKVGAFWVDQATTKSRRPSVDLISMPAADIIAMALK